MFKILSLAAVACAKHLYKEPLGVDPSAGSIGVVAHTKSLNHIMQNAIIPITILQVFSGKTFDLNIHEEGIGYTLDFKDLKINKVVGPNIRKFEQISDKQFKVTMGDLSLETTIDAELMALKFIPFVASGVNLKNVSIEFTVESVSDDQVHWALKDSSIVSLGDFDIHMSNKILDKLVELNKPIITMIIQGMMPKLAAVIDSEIQKLNQKVASETAYTFDINILGKQYPLNMTMTKAPEVDGEVVRLNFDGLFNQPENNAGFKMDSHGYFPHIEAQMEQVWIHENTFNSLVMDAIRAGKSVELDAANLIKEVADSYPKAKNYTTKTTIRDANKGSPIRLNVNDGIMIGHDKDLRFIMDLYADDIKVIQFSLTAMFRANFTMDKTFTFFPVLNDPQVITASVMHSEVPLKAGLHYDDVMKAYLSSAIDGFNTKYAKGVPVASLMPELGMISGVLKNATVSPQVANGWMFAGFSMQEDLNAKIDEPYELKFLAN